jgi:hypothetical protein
MAISAYISALQVLLHDQAGLAYPTSVLTGFINEGRQRIALESECIRGVGTLATVPGQNLYLCSAVTVPASPAGINGLATPRGLQYNPGLVIPGGASPQVTLEKRNWDWFNFYLLGLAAPPNGPPRAWCPLNQGGAFLPQGGSSAGPIATGSFYVNTPNAVYTLLVDGVWLPQNLAADADPEAIPGPFTDAVPLYGPYLGFMDARLNQLATEALQTYEVFMAAARGIVTPLPEQQAYPGGLGARRLPGQAPPQRGAEAGPTPGGGRRGG